MQLLHHFRDVATADRKGFADTLLDEQRADETKLEGVLRQIERNQLEAEQRTQELEAVVEKITEFLEELRSAPASDSLLQSEQATDELLGEARGDVVAARKLVQDRQGETDRVTAQLNAARAQTKRLEEVLDAWVQRDSELRDQLAIVASEQQAVTQQFERVRRMENSRIQATSRQSSDTQARIEAIDDELASVRMRRAELLTQRDSTEAAQSSVDVEAQLFVLNEREKRLVSERLTVARRMEEMADSEGSTNSGDLDTLRRQLRDNAQQLESLVAEQSENDLAVTRLLMSELGADREYLRVKILQQLIGTKEAKYQRVLQQVQTLPDAERPRNVELLASLEQIDRERRQLVALAADLEVGSSIQAGVDNLKNEIAATRKEASSVNLLTRAQDLAAQIQELDIKLVAVRRATEAWRRQNLVTLAMDARQQLPIKLDKDMHVKQTTGGEWAAIEGMQLVAINGQMVHSVDALGKALQKGSVRLSFAPPMREAKRLIVETGTLAQSRDRLQLAIEALRADSANLGDSADRAGRLEQALENIKLKYSAVDERLKQMPYDVAQSQQELLARLDQQNRDFQQSVARDKELIGQLQKSLSAAEQREDMLKQRVEAAREHKQKLESDMGAAATQEALLRDRLRDITAEYSMLEEALVKQEQVVRELTEGQQSDKREVERLRAQLSRVEEESQRIADKLVTLQADSESRSSDHAELQALYEQAQQRVSTLQGQKDAAAAQLQEANTELEALKNEQMRLREAAAQQQQLIKRLQDSKASETEQLEQEMRAALREELDARLDASAAEMESVVRQMQEYTANLLEEISRLDAENKSANELLQKLATALRASEAAGTALETEMLQAELDKQTSILEQLRTELANTEAAVMEKEEERRQASANHQALLSTHQKLGADRARLADELNVCAEEKLQLQQTAQQQTSENHALRDATERLEGELEAAKRETRSLKEQIDHSQADLASAQEELAVCRQTEEQLKRHQLELSSSSLAGIPEFKKALRKVQSIYEQPSEENPPESTIQNADNINEVISSMTAELAQLHSTVQQKKSEYLADLDQKESQISQQKGDLEILRETLQQKNNLEQKGISVNLDGNKIESTETKL